MKKRYMCLALAVSLAGCDSVSPVQVLGCSGSLKRDGRTPIAVRVKNYSRKSTASIDLAIYGVDDTGQPITGASPVRVDAMLRPGDSANVTYNGNPVLSFLTRRFGTPVRNIRCEPVAVSFTDGSKWQEPGPFP